MIVTIKSEHIKWNDQFIFAHQKENINNNSSQVNPFSNGVTWSPYSFGIQSSPTDPCVVWENLHKRRAIPICTRTSDHRHPTHVGKLHQEQEATEEFPISGTPNHHGVRMGTTISSTRSPIPNEEGHNWIPDHSRRWHIRQTGFGQLQEQFITSHHQTREHQNTPLMDATDCHPHRKLAQDHIPLSAKSGSTIKKENKTGTCHGRRGRNRPNPTGTNYTLAHPNALNIGLPQGQWVRYEATVGVNLPRLKWIRSGSPRTTTSESDFQPRIPVFFAFLPQFTHTCPFQDTVVFLKTHWPFSRPLMV